MWKFSDAVEFLMIKELREKFIYSLLYEIN